MSARDVLERWVQAMNTQDIATLERMLDPDFVIDYPQSGERLRGFDAFRRQIVEYPAGLQVGSVDTQAVQVVEGDERWAISPGYTVVPLAQPDRYTTVVRLGYPDGSWWQTVSIVQLRDEKILRIETYFAPEMPAPLAQSIASYPHG